MFMVLGYSWVFLSRTRAKAASEGACLSHGAVIVIIIVIVIDQ